MSDLDAALLWNMLSVAIACCVLYAPVTYIIARLSYDKGWERCDRMWRRWDEAVQAHAEKVKK
jgi:hypothetical protein